MNIYAFGPVAAALEAASAVLQFLSMSLTPLAGGASAALAIVALTVIVRLALIPVGLSQARAQRLRRRLAPRLADLQQRHRRDPQRLQRETMALYAEEGASPLAGCLPLLIQAPILSLVYGLFVLPTINGHANPLLAETLVGAPLGTGFVGELTAFTLNPDAAAGLVATGIVLALIAAVALVSRRFTLATTPPAAIAPPTSGPGRSGGGAGGGGVPSVLAPGGTVMQALTWLPLLTVVIGAFVPLAAALYLLVTTTWTLAERALLHRLIR
ncbi:YidC/Oxa1 family membrane protein insertase [Herbiconiux liangxiaofengii]|uniref:YidC/Oxa1 family membrane protein insertase n=1 Tax=Herbiconiux liangxiaofengii TaxID=3342795 RepID=UPI0035B848AD